MVRVAQFNSKFVFVTGAVTKPGRVALRNTPLTLIDAIQAASGFTSNANHHELKITRQGRTATVSSYEYSSPATCHRTSCYARVTWSMSPTTQPREFT